MKKFNVYLHIGTEKTGTTTIQNVLKDNKDVLDAHGAYYYYSRDINNSRNLASACIDISQHDEYLNNHVKGSLSREGYKDRTWLDFYSEINNLPSHVKTLIISSEHFHSRLVHEDNVLELYERLSPLADKITVICYLRRQVDMVLSLYSTILKGSGTDTLQETLDKYLNPQNQYSNYEMLLGKWSRVFGKDSLVVRKFDKSKFVNNNIVDDIFEIFKINAASLNSVKQDNESLTPLGQFLMSVINATALNDNKIRSEIARVYSGKGLVPSKEILDKYQGQFSESNLNVSKEWFPDEYFNNQSLFNDIEVDKQGNTLSVSQIKILDNVMCSLRNSSDFHLSKKMKSLDDMVDHLKIASKILSSIDPQLAYNIISIADIIRNNGPEILSIKKDISQLIGERNV